MVRKSYRIDLKPGQPLYFIPLGDIHWDSAESDHDRLQRLIEWIERKKRGGAIVRWLGMGDYLDFGSPSERHKITAADLHDTTNVSVDKMHLASLQEFVSVMRPIGRDGLGLLTGHHHYIFATQRGAGAWKGKSSDEWLATRLGTDYLGSGIALFRMQLPHDLHLDVLALHGGGSAQTPGGRVMKRIRFGEIAPTAHIVVSGHDNAKLVYPRSGLDYEHGSIKRYVVGSGSFQRAYIEGPEAGYAERAGLVPADLGVSIFTIQIEQRRGVWRTDYHCSV